MRRLFSNKAIKLGAIAITFVAARCANKPPVNPPNVVIIFTDDQGYNDLSCYGSTLVNTPNIDKMASEGVRLTSFYVQALCSPSRAALLTGSYPRRIGLATGSRYSVLWSNDEHGLNPDEITIAELLKKKGYATAIFGKWHLGDQPEFLPTKQGFDEFFGLPYSVDMHPYHPNQANFHFPPLPLYEGEVVIETDPDIDFMTQRITERAVHFIDSHKDSPFFLYIPHPMPHVPLHVSPPFMKLADAEIRNKLKEEKGFVDYETRNKLYPLVISEIDSSVGEIFKALKRNGLEKNTLVIFTSDNGPLKLNGSAKPLRGEKGSCYEGGVRVPAIAWWPGKIPPKYVCDEMLSSMDLYPTIARLAGVEIPNDRILDGMDIWPVLSKVPGARSPHDKLFYHVGNTLCGVRSGKWKLHRTTSDGLELYDLENDISEQKNVVKEYPEVVKRLEGYMNEFDLEMSDVTKIRPMGVAHRSNNKRKTRKENKN